MESLWFPSSVQGLWDEGKLSLSLKLLKNPDGDSPMVYSMIPLVVMRKSLDDKSLSPTAVTAALLSLQSSGSFWPSESKATPKTSGQKSKNPFGCECFQSRQEMPSWAEVFAKPGGIIGGDISMEI